MNYREIEAREDLAVSVPLAFQIGLEVATGCALTVSRRPQEGEQIWYLNSVFGVVHPCYSAPASRRLLADSIRWTSVRARLPVQFIAGTCCATPAALRLSRRPYLWVTPAVPRDSHIIVLLGNRRLRVFDTELRRSQVIAKHGFDGGPIRREISLRLGRPGPYPEMTRSSLATGWYEEPLLAGRPLSRLARRSTRVQASNDALRQLSDWQASSLRGRNPSDYAQELLVKIEACREQMLAAETATLPRSIELERLAILLRRMGELAIGDTHGDFQAGNVFVTESGPVHLIDWEYAALRWVGYDYLVFGLGLRFPVGLTDRIERYVAMGKLAPTAASSYLDSNEQRSWREAAVALILLEELATTSEEQVNEPYVQPSSRLRSVSAEIRRFAKRVHSGRN